jgi:predicted RNA-binding Zn-ribbon protein involved in translation (DUF1610 family)
MSNKQIFEQIEAIKSKLRIHDEITEGMDSVFLEQMKLGYQEQIAELQTQLKLKDMPLPVCPHCGCEELSPSTEYDKIQCDNCEGHFIYVSETHEKDGEHYHTFTTKKA